MAKSPPPQEWPTQVQEAPTTVIENGAPAPAPAPPPVDPRRRAFDDMWPWLFALALLVIAGLVAPGLVALWWFQYHYRSHGSRGTAPVTQPTFASTTLATPAAKVAVPRVIGLTQAEATAKLAQAGLKPQPAPVKSLAAPGTVIAQKPAPGTQVRHGGVVRLSVSRGKPAAAVPDVTGQPAPQAVSALRKAGFATAVAGVPSAQPKGFVVAEAPAAGTRAAAGTTIRLNISKGVPRPAGTTPAPTTSAPARTTSTPAGTTPAPKPAALIVPEVTSHALFPAIRTLEQAGLHAQVTLVQSSQPAGRVISQQPAAQSKAGKGEVVQLSVSLGPNPAQLTQVPDVTGQDVQQATQTLQNAGFTVETVDRKVIAAAQDGKVVDLEPNGEAPQGFTIVLIVGRAA